MAKKFFILEDNADRREAMRNCLAHRFQQYEVCFSPSASEMIEILHRGLQDALLISLDHDLDPEEPVNGSWPDYGDGRMVADFLATQQPVCPAVIHSTNSPASVGMKSVLEEAQWKTYRVKPYFDLQWINELWFPTVLEAVDAETSADQPI